MINWTFIIVGFIVFWGVIFLFTYKAEPIYKFLKWLGLFK